MEFPTLGGVGGCNPEKVSTELHLGERYVSGSSIFAQERIMNYINYINYINYHFNYF